MASRDLRVTLIGDDQTGGAFGSAARGAAGLQTRFAAIGSAVGNLAANGISAGLSAITNFASGAVDAFAAVEDATGAAGVQFGSALPKVLQFAEQASKGFGMSKREALEAQNTFGTFGKAAGMTGEELAGFSGKLAGLAGDMASFKGTSVEQAIGAIGSALKGESDPIEAFGVQMNDAAIKAEALSQGLIKTTKEALTPQQKTLAVTSLLFKQTADAQGDYARTSDGTANTQKTLAAEMENAQVALGEKLAPALTVVRQVMLGLVKGAGGLIDALAPVTSAVTQVVEALLTGDFKGGFLSEDSPIIAGVFRVRDAFQTVKEYLDVFWTALSGRSEVGEFEGALRVVNDAAIGVRDALSGFVGFVRDRLQPILSVVAGMLGGALVPALIGLAGVIVGPVVAAVVGLVGALASPVVAIGALIGAVIYAYKNFEGFRDVVDRVADFITGTVIPAFLQLAQKVQEYVGAAVDSVRANWPEIRATIEAVLTAVRAFISTWVTVLQEMWRRFGDNVLDTVKVAFELIKNSVQNTLNVIQGIIKTVSALIRGDWSAAWDGIKQILSAVWDQIGTLVRGALSALKIAVQLGLDALRGVFDLAWAGIKAAVSAAWDAIKAVVSAQLESIRSTVSSVTSAVAGFFTTNFGKLKGIVSGAIEGVLGVLRGLPGQITSALGNVGSLLFNAGRSIVQGLIDGITDKIGALARKMSELAQMAKDFLPFSPAKRGPLSGRGNPYYSGQSIVDLWGDGMKSRRGALASTVAGLTDIGDLAGMHLGGSDFIHRRIAAAGQSPSPIGGSDSAMLAELQALRASNERLEQRLRDMPDDYRLADRSTRGYR